MAGFIGPGGYRVRITEIGGTLPGSASAFFFAIFPPADRITGVWSREPVAQSGRPGGYSNYANAKRAGEDACRRLVIRDQQQWAEARGLGTD